MKLPNSALHSKQVVVHCNIVVYGNNIHSWILSEERKNSIYSLDLRAVKNRIFRFRSTENIPHYNAK